MAGPLSSEEIEDVVSSVRRLVSNEQHPRTQSRDLGVDRLILTPALRVVAETSPLAPLMLQTPMNEAPVGPVPEAVNPPEATVLQPLDEGGNAIDAVWEDELWVELEDASLAEIALGAEEAEVLPPPTDAETAAPFASDVEEVPEPWEQVENEWVEDDPIPFVPLRRRAENLAARLAAGAIKDTTRNDPDPEAPLATEPAAVVRPEADENAATIEADRETDVEERSAQQRMPTEIIDADGVPLAVLDEEALQEIVRLMIRDELQGDLGERITRAVRKLVRAEINRALVSRDLD